MSPLGFESRIPASFRPAYSNHHAVGAGAEIPSSTYIHIKNSTTYYKSVLQFVILKMTLQSHQANQMNVTVQWWHKHFRKRRVSTEDNLGCGCPSTASGNTNTDIFATVLDEDKYAMVREIEAKTVMPQTTLHHILTEYLFKTKVGECWVPHTLTDTQKQTCLEIMQEYLK